MRKGLVVAEEYVVTRMVGFNQIVFQQQRIEFGIDKGKFDKFDQSHHAAGLSIV